MSLVFGSGYLVESQFLSGVINCGVRSFERSKEIRNKLTFEESMISIAYNRHTDKNFTILTGRVEVCDSK